MSKIKVNVSKQDLTRCHHCLRHVKFDRTLSEKELLKLTCTFCDSLLFTGIKKDISHPVAFHNVIHRSPIKQQRFGNRGSRLAAGILSIGLALAGCEEEETIEAGSEDTDSAKSKTKVIQDN